MSDTIHMMIATAMGSDLEAKPFCEAPTGDFKWTYKEKEVTCPQCLAVLAQLRERLRACEIFPLDPKREPLHLPEGYRAVIDGDSVSFYRKGFENPEVKDGDYEKELIFKSNMLHYRRPSFWCASGLSEIDSKVLQEALWNGWEKILAL